jgi:hypothetical protein
MTTSYQTPAHLSIGLDSAPNTEATQEPGANNATESVPGDALTESMPGDGPSQLSH